MDNIEYLEEYEDLIMPGGTTEDGTARDDESSSSIDQDIFESLFDDQSDDETEIVPKKVEEQAKRHQERESLDSLDMLVRDLGEPVNVKNEQEKCRSINESSTLIVNTALPKPIMPCLKKTTLDSSSTDGRASAQEKPQKRVMFAKLPTVKRTSTPSSSSSRAHTSENIEQYRSSGCKPIDNVKTGAEATKHSDFNRQRKLNRSQLTIVKPEKIQFKDPVDDPLSLEKVESDLESLSDVSDDSFASLSDIFVTAPEPKDNNKDQQQKMDTEETTTTQNANIIQTPPAHISTANLPEKVTIISDTVLSRIDTALLESLATNESKDVFSKDQKTKNDSDMQTVIEVIQPENTNQQDSETNVIIEKYDENIEERVENTFALTSAVSDEINVSKLSTEIETTTNPNSIKSLETQSKIVDYIEDSKDLEKNNDGFVEKEVYIDASAEKSKEVEKQCTEPLKENPNQASAENKIDIDLQIQTKMENNEEIVSKSTSQNALTSKDIKNADSENQKTVDNKSEKQKNSQANETKESKLSETPKKENQKGTTKKVSTDKAETKKVEQITTQAITTTPNVDKDKDKTVSIVSRPQDKCKESSKEQTKKTIAESTKKEATYKVPKTVEKNTGNQQSQKPKEPTSKESVLKSPKKDPTKSNVSSESASKKNLVKAANSNETQKKVEQQDLSNLPSSSSTKNTTSRQEINQSSSSSVAQSSSNKSIRKSSADSVPKQSTPKTESIENPKRNYNNNAKPSRESLNASSSSKKVEIKSQQNTKEAQVKKSSNSSNTKTEDKKVFVSKETESSAIKNVDDVRAKIPKIPESRCSKEPVDNKQSQTQSNKQKDNTQYEKNTSKSSDSKSESEKASSVNSPVVKKDVSKLVPKTVPTSSPNTEKVFKRSDGTRHSLKREISQTTIDNSSTKRFRSISGGSTDETAKPNKLNERDISRNNNKKEDETKNTKTSIVKEDTNIAKPLNRKSSSSDIKRKDESSTKQQAFSPLTSLKASKKDYGKSPVKKPETTSTSKAGSSSTLAPTDDKNKSQKSTLTPTDDKNKSQSSTLAPTDVKNKSQKSTLAPTDDKNKSQSSTFTPTDDKNKSQSEQLKTKPSSSNSVQSNKTPGKHNRSTTSISEVPSVTKNKKVPATTNLQSRNIPTKNTAEVKEPETAQTSSSPPDNIANNSKKSNERSTSVEVIENKTTEKSSSSKINSIATVVKSDKDKTHHTAQESNKTNVTEVKITTPSNQQDVCSESNSNKVQPTIVEENKTPSSNSSSSNKKQIPKTLPTSVQEKKTSLTEKVSDSISKVKPTETTIESTSLTTTNITSSEIEPVNNIENIIDSVSKISEELKDTQQQEQLHSVETKNDTTTTKTDTTTTKTDTKTTKTDTNTTKTDATTTKNEKSQQIVPTTTTPTTSKRENTIPNVDKRIATNSPSKSSKIKKDLTEIELRTCKTITQESFEIVKKDSDANSLNVVLRKKQPAIEQKSNTSILEQTTSNQKTTRSMETGLRRQLRKRAIETLNTSELDSTNVSIDKKQAAKLLDPSKEIVKSTIENCTGEKQAKRGRPRKSLRVREVVDSFNIEVETNKTPNLQQNNEESNTNTNRNKLSNQAEPMQENAQALKSKTDQASKTMLISPDEEQVTSAILNKEHKEPTLSEMETETENELLHDSKLDSLSMTSVESAAFSGFTDSPVNILLNEKSIDSSLTASKAAQDLTASIDKHVTPSSSSLTSAVITFNEWLARKNIEQSVQEKVIESNENMETSACDAEKSQTDEAPTNNTNIEEQNSAAKKDATKPSSTVNLQPKPNPKPPKPKKTELDMLKESMSKEMRESGIDRLIESHFSSPHCLTKRSVAARQNAKRITLTSSMRKGTIKTVSPASSQASTTAKKLISPNISIHTPVNLAVNRKRTRNAHKDERHAIRQAPLPLKCRNVCVRINRSVVKLYFKNLKTRATNNLQHQQQQAAKPNNVSMTDTVHGQIKAKGNKRKAAKQTAGPPAKKPLINTSLEQSMEHSSSEALPAPQTLTPSRSVRFNASSRAKVMTISPKNRSGPLAEAELSTTEPVVSAQSSTISPIKSGSKTSALERELLKPISVAPVQATSIESSRRAPAKRSIAATTSATTINTAVSNSGKVPTVCSTALTLPKPTQSIENEQQQQQQPAVLPKPVPPTTSNIAPKTECEDEYDAVYRQALQSTSKTAMPSLAASSTSSSVSPLSSSTDVRANIPAVSSTVPLVISGATSHSLPPIAIDNAGTRIYSFLHPTKYNNSHGYVMLDYCCPNLDGPMTAIDPTRRHAKVDVVIRELPAYITMETRLVTRAELEADSSALPASIRHKVQRITGSKGPGAKATPCISLTTSSAISTNLTSKTNVTPTTTVAPKATTAASSTATTSSTSNSNVSAAVSASVSALQKQLPSTTTLTPKTMPTAPTVAAYKTTPGSTSSGVAPTATITPTTLGEMRLKLSNSLKKYDILLKKHYPRISLLSFNQRQEIIEALSNSTQLLPRDIETATRLLQEYVTQMALKTASKSLPTNELSAPSTSSPAAGTARATSTITAANTSAAATAAVKELPPVTTRANSKRNTTAPQNFQRRSVPIYNSDKTVIGYQVQMVNTSTPGTTTSQQTLATSTTARRIPKSNTAVLSTSASTSTATRRSGVFVIDKPNASAPTTPLLPVSNTTTPRMMYQKPNLRTPTSMATMVHTPQASSTPLSSAGSIVTRSGGPRIGRGVTVRQVPTRAATTKMHSPAIVAPPVTITTTSSSSSSSSLPRLPTLTRNPHLPPLSSAPSSQPTTPITARNMPGINVGGNGNVSIEQATFQKRLTRKTAAASVSELLVVNHDSLGNPLPTAEESILPDESNATPAAHIKSEHPDEF